MQYELKGGSFPVVICQLQNGEAMKTEAGSMVWMSDTMEMSTNAGGGLGGMFSRAFSGENMFQNIYRANGDGMIAFGSSFPGKILALQVTPAQNFILQKKAFLASEMGVELTMYVNRKLGAGFFGGEGFIMQKVSGNGIVFVEVDGEFMEYELQAGQRMIVDTGYLLGMEASVNMDIQEVPGLKNKLLGGEGLFNTVLTGPGKIWLQTMPISGLANALRPFFPRN